MRVFGEAPSSSETLTTRQIPVPDGRDHARRSRVDRPSRREAYRRSLSHRGRYPRPRSSRPSRGATGTIRAGPMDADAPRHFWPSSWGPRTKRPRAAKGFAVSCKVIVCFYHTGKIIFPIAITMAGPHGLELKFAPEPRLPRPLSCSEPPRGLVEVRWQALPIPPART
jgi:hypothetical protein